MRTRPCRAVRVDRTCFRIVLTQGLNRQIRRMCAVFGVRVRTLKRIRILNLELDGMKPGELRELEPEELRELQKRVRGNGHG